MRRRRQERGYPLHKLYYVVGSVHGKMSRKGRRSGPKRSYTKWIVLALVLVTGIVGYEIFTQSGAGSGSPLNGQAVSPTILNQLSGVSINTLNQVGSGPYGVTAN